MRGVNKVIIVGHLGADPELKTFSNGGTIANLNIATSEQWTDKQTGEQREHTEWHRVVLNNRVAEVAAQYLRKGSAVYIEGSLRTRKWQDQNGQDRWTTEIRGQNMQMLGGRNDSMSQMSGGMGQNQPYQNQNNQYGNQPNTGNQFNQMNNQPANNQMANHQTNNQMTNQTNGNQMTNSQPAAPVSQPVPTPPDNAIVDEDLPF